MRVVNIFCALCALMAVGCVPKSVVVGVDTVVEHELSYDCPVTGIAISSGFDVELSEAVADGTIMVVVPENIVPYVVVEQKEGVLYVGLDRNNAYHVDELKAVVNPSQITTFMLSGGSELSYDNIVVPGDISLALSGGSEVELKGECDGLAVALSGGSELDVEELRAKHVVVAASGGSTAEIYAEKSLEVAASGGSEIEYLGDPMVKEIQATGGSQVSRK